MQHLPDEFLERLALILPEDRLAGVIAHLHANKPVFARLNPLQAPPEQTLEHLVNAGLRAVPVPWMSTGFMVPLEQREQLTHSEPASDGRLYIQNPSSWLPVLALGVQPGMEVLDLAAAPGGKTTHIAALMDNEGRLAAVEPVRDRFFRLRGNLERCGVTIGATYRKDGRLVGRQVPGRFDRVLLDAPCSSEARFIAGEPDSWAHWSPRKVKEVSRKQKGLIMSAFDALKPGGRMVYSTCSFSPEENELIVAQLLRRRPEARLVVPELPAEVPWIDGITEWEGRSYDEALTACRRILPDEHFDGFFFAVIDKA